MSISVAVADRPLAVESEQESLLQRIAGHFLVRRIVKAIVTIWLVVSVTFFLIHLMPGNPIDQYVEQQVTQFGIPVDVARAQAAALFSLDLSRPLPLQYLDFLGNLVPATWASR